MEKDKINPETIITPNDILEEILQYLPMKSLAKFKAVSKQWRSMIESTYLSHIRLVRLGLQTPNTKLLVVHQLSSDSDSTTLVLKTFSRDHDNNGQICLSSSSSYTFPHNPINQSRHETIQVLGSCDGLVLVGPYDFKYIYLINPTTGEDRTLSPELLQWPGYFSYHSLVNNPTMNRTVFQADMLKQQGTSFFLFNKWS